MTNDDGPPSGPDGHSPFVYRFARQLVTQLGADVRVVVPASQRSWVGKSYMIAQKVIGAYYYARGEDGTEGETCELPRKCQGDEMEWILLDGTPGTSSLDLKRRLESRPDGRSIPACFSAATCASIALHNLFPAGSFDLVVSGYVLGVRACTACDSDRRRHTHPARPSLRRPNFGRNTSTAFALSS